jgi:hypothetical protein
VAVKSAINPGAIVNSKPIRVSAAQNFITGGTPLGESVLTNAANKIVGFQRGAAQVSARPPDLGSIINTLSSSIISNVENRLQSVNQNVVNIVNNKLQGIETDYAGRISKLDPDNQPSNILKNFLNLYKEAIGYIQFLGNKKNVKTLGDNLTTLQNIFKETFDVAKIIRQTIVKIVGQLSNLPSASGGGGGLNLDIDVPGGPLKRTAPRGVTKLGKMALAGTAIAGAGALGTKVVSGMMDVGGGDVQPTPTGDVSGGLSGPMLDRFNNILDRFSSAIANFKPPKQETSAQKTSTAAPTNNEPAGGQDSTGTAGATSGQSKGVTTTGEKGVLDLIASVEQGPEGYNSFNTSAGKTKGKATEQTIGWLAKNANGAIGRYQQMPQYLVERAKRAGFDENTKFTPEVQDAITLNELRGPQHKMGDFLSGKITEEQFLQKLSPTWRGLPQGQINANKLGGTVDMTYQDAYAGRNAAGKKYTQTISELKNIRGGGNKPIAPQLQKSPTVTAAPTQSTTAQQVSQQVAQQPGANQPSQPLMVPINLTNQQPQQQTQPSPPPPPPILSNDGTKIPNIGSTNFDNFLTLYSRITYNVVES